ncbi:MAG: tRNA pseudouridine(55) synthase TruB [Actinomycetes bacterium]
MGHRPRDRTAPDGLVVVDKPAGMTSHDVVARVRKLAGSRKVGHAGTLDPMATGVLLVGIERATRLLGHLALTDKTYDATIRLGISTITDDAEGEVIASTDASAVSDDAIRAGVRILTGDILQRPSSVSALKVDGVRAHVRVRAGEELDLPERPTRVSLFEVHDIRREGLLIDIDVTVECSTGTYIRALARDLGSALGVGGHLTSLRRTRVGAFGIELAHPLAELEQSFAFEPLGKVVAAAFGRIEVDEITADSVLHGGQIPVPANCYGAVGIYGPDGAVLSLAEPRGEIMAALVVFS